MAVTQSASFSKRNDAVTTQEARPAGCTHQPEKPIPVISTLRPLGANNVRPATRIGLSMDNLMTLTCSKDLVFATLRMREFGHRCHSIVARGYRGPMID